MDSAPQSGPAQAGPSVPTFTLRPIPNPHEQARIHKGKRFVSSAASASWFTNGAVEVSAEGITVVDADGRRHGFPVAEGSQLQIARHSLDSADSTVDAWLVDADNKILVELPQDGIALARYKDLAAAAGLEYRVVNYELSDPTGPMPRYESSHTMMRYTALKARDDRVLHRIVHPSRWTTRAR